MTPSRTKKAAMVRIGILGLFCPKLQSRASQSKDDKRNVHMSIGLLALFEVEYDLGIPIALRAQFERSLHAWVSLTRDDPFDLCPEPPCGLSLMQ
jgi:hypothetical protein